MRYFFTSKLEKTGEGVTIQIPFNIWEVCKQRDTIQADIVIDNQIIECELVPLEKGRYEIHLPAGVEIKASYETTHKLLLHVSGSLIRMDQNSPYSFDNPIRKIDSVDIIIQPADGLCGQTVIAMLAGVTIADVIKVMDCREWQGTMGRLISALNYYGIDHTDIIVYPGEDEKVVLPKCAILMEKMGRFSHYLLCFDGKFYDPNLGVMEEYDMSKLLGYLEIKL
ncbi:MAG: DUF1905 domain-containing protein [Lachnospiraceae bacterium]|nr:DUF1905 domain-containing protein [Lachnospiraceae bacterium]